MAMTSALVDEPSQRGRLTLPMLILTIFSAVGGFLFGYDTGVVSGAMLLVRDEFALTNLWHEMIVSATIAAAWITAMFSGRIADWIGRRRVIILASILFTVGSLIMACAPEKITLLCGRVVVGVGLGFASMVVPVYLSEVAEASARGRITVTNVVFITGGQFVASLICGAFSSVDSGWRYMFGIAAVPALLQFVGFLFLPESPRWLVGQDRVDEAYNVLAKFRSPADDIDKELQLISDAAEEEKELGEVSLARIWQDNCTRRALILGSLLQMFQQLAGVNTVMYYSASIIRMAGIGDPSQAIWMSAVTAAFNFAFTFVGLALVERVGRRPLVLCSLLGVIFALLELGVSFNVMYVNSPDVGDTSNDTYSDLCSQYLSCSSCTSSNDCGFCFLSSDALYNNASCLPSDTSQFNEVSTIGACVVPEEGFTFAYDWCPSGNASFAAVAGLAIYLMLFAPGMGTMPWTINSEIFPSWARARCVAITTSVNWFFNMFVSLTFLSLTELITKHGTFYLYSGLAGVGLGIFFWSLPETKGSTLEDVYLLFRKPLFEKKPKTLQASQ